VASEKLDFLNAPASEVAPRLLGCVLEREIDGQIVQARIVETEAYDQTDVASHSYNGRTPRTEVMFGLSGHLYVYFTYGMHYCCNVVVGDEGYGAAVLLRAVEPLSGVEIMAKNRGGRSGVDITNGPAKLCQALMIDKAMNGHDLRGGALRLVPKPAQPDESITRTTRIGISRAKDVPWRFYITDNEWVSRNRAKG
jgi:DNA-3-methyladenine glycosylase